MKTYTADQLSDPKNADLLEEIVLLISYSFTEDPGHRWLFSDHTREQYVKVLPSYIRILVRLGLLCQASIRVITQDELPPSAAADKQEDNLSEPQVKLPPNATIRALAIVIPPSGNANFDSPLMLMRAGMLGLPFHCGIGMVWRLLTGFLPGFHKLHTGMFPDPALEYHNWHLFYLATHPQNRGQGLGKQLLLDIQDSVREYNVSKASVAQQTGEKFVTAPLYLEASSLVNKRLYNRVGFEDRSDMVFGKLDDGEDLKFADDGSVIGGRSFGMVWTP